MPKRGDRVAPPSAPGEWDLRYGDSGAVEGWEQLCSQAPGPALVAWTALRTDPRARSQRQHPLKGDFATRSVGGRLLDQWHEIRPADSDRRDEIVMCSWIVMCCIGDGCRPRPRSVVLFGVAE